MIKNKLTTSIILTAIFVLLWQVFIVLRNYSQVPGTASIEAFVPSPLTVVRTFYLMRRVLFSELTYTLARAFLGLAIGIVFAIFANALFFIKPVFKQLFLPLSLAVNSFPIIGFSPLLILAFGQGSWIGIVFISTLISYFPVLITLEKALSLTSNEFYELGRIWKASKISIFARIQLPLVLPYVIGSLKLAVPASIIGATLGEWLGSNHGIGKLVVVSLYQLNPGLLYASLLLLLVSSLLTVWLSEVIEGRFFPWVKI